MLFYFEFSCIQTLLNIHINELLFCKLISNTIYVCVFVCLHMRKCDAKCNFCPPSSQILAPPLVLVGGRVQPLWMVKIGVFIGELEGVWSLISKHIVQCLNTEQYCSKTKKICLVNHSRTGLFEKYCSKHMFKTIVFEITFRLILNNKNYC